MSLVIGCGVSPGPTCIVLFWKWLCCSSQQLDYNSTCTSLSSIALKIRAVISGRTEVPRVR